MPGHENFRDALGARELPPLGLRRPRLHQESELPAGPAYYMPADESGLRVDHLLGGSIEVLDMAVERDDAGDVRTEVQ